jgi:NADH-quinone oxidoreductase subunit L
MRNMGGLRKYMPVTFWTFVASWAAIVAVPGTAGFFSKDEILFKAYTSRVVSEMPTLAGGRGQVELFQWPPWAPTVLFILGLLGATMTAFYMTRLVIGIFLGKFRGWTISRRWQAPVQEHAHADDEPHHEPYEPGVPIEGPRPHESPWQMTAPLVILGGLAIVGGFLNAHALFHLHPLDDFLHPVFAKAQTAVKEVPGAEALETALLGPGIIALVVGAGTAYWVYVLSRGAPAAALRERLPGLYRLVYDKWRIDELYEETVIGAVDSLAELSVLFDKWVVDGIIARFTSFVVAATGTVLRYVQTGHVQAYATVMVVGVGGLGWFLIAPHASARSTVDHAGGKYSLTAAPGLGYAYRWDANGDGKWDAEEFGDTRTVAFDLGIDKSRVVRLEVINAFGRTSSEEFAFHRPKPDASGITTIGVERAPDGTLRGVVPGQQPGQAINQVQRQAQDAQQRAQGSQGAANNLLRMLQQQGQPQPGQPQPGQQVPRQVQPGQLQPQAPQPGRPQPLGQPLQPGQVQPQQPGARPPIRQIKPQPQQPPAGAP